MTRSNCTGSKKAVIIGVDYEGSGSELQSPISDTFHLRIELDLIRGFKQNHTRIYTDVEEENRLPTKANIKKAMRWLVQSAKPNDSLFFYFSGHGGRSRGSNGHSFIWTTDDKKITGEELREILVDGLPSGCRLTAVFDCCHPGNILDLKYSYESTQDLKDDDPTTEGESTSADVVCWSACAENETASDAPFSKGYLSNGFIQDEDSTYLTMFRNIRNICPKRQHPQLSDSHRIHGDRKFIM